MLANRLSAHISSFHLFLAVCVRTSHTVRRGHTFYLVEDWDLSDFGRGLLSGVWLLNGSWPAAVDAHLGFLDVGPLDLEPLEVVHRLLEADVVPLRVAVVVPASVGGKGQIPGLFSVPLSPSLQESRHAGTRRESRGRERGEAGKQRGRKEWSQEAARRESRVAGERKEAGT